jgi:hypothetical protein
MTLLTCTARIHRGKAQWRKPEYRECEHPVPGLGVSLHLSHDHGVPRLAHHPWYRLPILWSFSTEVCTSHVVPVIGCYGGVSLHNTNLSQSVANDIVVYASSGCSGVIPLPTLELPARSSATWQTLALRTSCLPLLPDLLSCRKSCFVCTRCFSVLVPCSLLLAGLSSVAAFFPR